MHKASQCKMSEPENGERKAPVKGQLNMGIRAKQDEEDIFVGLVPGVRNSGLNKVRKLMYMRGCGGNGMVRGEESIHVGKEKQAQWEMVTYRETGQIIKY